MAFSLVSAFVAQSVRTEPPRCGQVKFMMRMGVVVSYLGAFFHAIKGVVGRRHPVISVCSIKTGCWFVNNLVKCRIEQRLLCTYGVVALVVCLLVQAGDEDEQRLLLWRSRRYAQLRERVRRRFCISSLSTQSSFGSMPELLLMLLLLLFLLL